MTENRLHTPPPISAPSRTTWARRYEAVSRRLRILLRLRRLYLLRFELRFVPTEAQRLFALTVAIGVLCGLAAVAFHLTIHFFEHHLIERALSAAGRSWIGWTIAVPIVGGLACGALLQYVVPNARGSGIPQVKVAFSQGGRIRTRDAFGKFFISSLQIGTGASLGREGPTVQICAGIASLLGRLVGVSAKSQRRLLPVGVAAGIAAAFNAPIAAVTFTIEEVVGNLDQAVLSGVIVAAALSAVIERSVLGESSVFAIPQSYGLLHASSLLVYAIIGLSAAVVSVIFTESLLGLRASFRRLRSVPEWVRPALGGAVTGCLAVAALWGCGVRGVTGGGYATLGQALTGQLAPRILLALCAMKVVSTVFSYSSGGAGGIFAPSLFIGGTLGGAVGLLDNVLLGHYDESAGAFALVGMGAVFAGVVRAPITSVLIIIEMTQGYSLILPLMIANMTAYVLARHWRPRSIYEALLEQDGVHLPVSQGTDGLESTVVDRVLNRVGPFHDFASAAGALEISRVSHATSTQHVFPVLDSQRHLLGIITSEELRILDSEPDLLPVVTASDLMRPPVSVHLGDDLRRALEVMLANGIREVPVTDMVGCFLGFIDEAAIASAYVRRNKESMQASAAP
ncbi:MAG TPA: chloride channel protein [Polyangiaceae bacterium]|nr:chloride channel protein [Polyangiaceae bacterium]